MPAKMMGGEVLCVAFVLDCVDREVIATMAGSSDTIEFALALNLGSLLHPGRPKNSGIAEGFAKMFKRDDVSADPIPSAKSALAAILVRTDDHNAVFPRDRLRYRSPRE